MQVKVKKLTKDAPLPTYATDGSACFDLYATAHAVVGAGSFCAIPTGLAFEIPPGRALMIYSRSGHGFKNQVRLANAVGCLDSDFRGECKVGLFNDGMDAFYVKPGDRIAQAMIIQTQAVSFVEVDELSSTARGEGGFGSSGA